MASKGKIGVLIEEHFDQTRIQTVQRAFPTRGYEVEHLSHLWGNEELRFGANPDDGVIGAAVTVSTEINDVNPSDYKGIIAIGATPWTACAIRSTSRRDRRTTHPPWPSCAKPKQPRAEARHDPPPPYGCSARTPIC